MAFRFGPPQIPAIGIGNQVWMQYNLDVETYRNGDPIPQVTDPTTWKNLTTGAWCWYNNDSANGLIYGKLYNGYAVTDPRGLAPYGWHIPSVTEFITLATNLGGAINGASSYSVAGGKLKEAGTDHWLSPNTGADNSSRFTGLPGGNRSYGNGAFNTLTTNGYWWSSTFSGLLGGAMRLVYNISSVYIYAGGSFQIPNGYSVRCIKD